MYILYCCKRTKLKLFISVFSLPLPKWSGFCALKIPDQQTVNIWGGEHAWSLRNHAHGMCHHGSQFITAFLPHVVTQNQWSAACCMCCYLTSCNDQELGGALWAADISVRPVFPHTNPSTGRRQEAAVLGWVLVSPGGNHFSWQYTRSWQQEWWP